MEVFVARQPIFDGDGEVVAYELLSGHRPFENDSPTAEAAGRTHQNWLWSPTEHAFVLDVFRESHEEDTWVCRRDPTIRRPWPEVVRTTSDGIPYLSPEVVLLFKAKYVRAKDEADLRAVLPVLDADRRAWLHAAVARVHPGHPWLRRVRATG